MRKRVFTGSAIAELLIWQGDTLARAVTALVAYCAGTGRNDSVLKKRLARAAKMIGVKPITAA